MKLLLFSIVLTISTSRQQDSTETLNETLDRLIKQTTQAGYSETNENNLYSNENDSKIFFLKPPESQSEKNSDAKAPNTQINDGQVNIADILDALGLNNPKSEQNYEKTNTLKEITFTEDGDTEPQTTNTDTTEVYKVEMLSSRSGAPTVVEDSSANALSTSSVSKTEMNLHHRYPEIIIDKIVYPGNKNKSENLTKNGAVTEIKQVDLAAEKQNSIKIALELKSLLEELQKIKKENDSENNRRKSSHYTVSQINEEKKRENKSENNKRRSSNTVPKITDPREKAILQPCTTCVLEDKITHQNSQRSGRPGLDAKLQLKTWEKLSEKHNALMIISKAEKLKRIQHIPRLINKVIPRFVYRPLYGYFYH